MNKQLFKSKSENLEESLPFQIYSTFKPWNCSIDKVSFGSNDEL